MLSWWCCTLCSCADAGKVVCVCCCGTLPESPSRSLAGTRPLGHGPTAVPIPTRRRGNWNSTHNTGGREDQGQPHGRHNTTRHAHETKTRPFFGTHPVPSRYPPPWDFSSVFSTEPGSALRPARAAARLACARPAPHMALLRTNGRRGATLHTATCSILHSHLFRGHQCSWLC